MKNTILTLISTFFLCANPTLLAKSTKVKAKDLSQKVKLSDAVEFKLNSHWMKHPPLRGHKGAPTYPFIEHKKIKGLVATFSMQKKDIRHKKMFKKWSKLSCDELVSHFPKDHIKLEFDDQKSMCKVILPATSKSKGMIQYRRGHWIASSPKDKAIIVTTNFFTPMLSKDGNSAQWKSMKDAVSELMKAN